MPQLGGSRGLARSLATAVKGADSVLRATGKARKRNDLLEVALVQFRHTGIQAADFDAWLVVVPD
jgi:hypothetical protein